MQYHFDFSLITIKEYRQLFGGSLSQDKEDELVAKVAGMTADELQNMPVPEYRRFLKAFATAAAAPVDENPT